MTNKEAFDSVRKYFDGDDKKAAFWWNTKNPIFGNIRPVDVLDRAPERVYEFIRYATGVSEGQVHESKGAEDE